MVSAGTERGCTVIEKERGEQKEIQSIDLYRPFVTSYICGMSMING